TASGPANVMLANSPPRASAPGSPASLAPTKHWKSPDGLASPFQKLTHSGSDRGTQSATHSARLPTMSKAPSAETQLLRSPVPTAIVPVVLQSVMPLSGPGSGVPTTAACHSALEGRRLPEFVHACCAWNQVIHADGVTPSTLTA